MGTLTAGTDASSTPSNTFPTCRKFALLIVAAALSGCAVSPPPVSLSHDLPPVDNSGRNHATVTGSLACVSACESRVVPFQASYLHRFGDDLYAGLSQSIDALSFDASAPGLPQTRLIAAIDAADGWLPHTGLGFGWVSNSTLRPHYATLEFGVRRQVQTGEISLRLDPIMAASFPVFGSGLGGYGFALLNGGLVFRPSEAFRFSGGPTIGWAQPLDGTSGFMISALSIGTTFSF